MKNREVEPIATDWTRRRHGRIWALALPIMLANVSIPLVGAVDTAVMGHLPSESLTYLLFLDPGLERAGGAGAIRFVVCLDGVLRGEGVDPAGLVSEDREPDPARGNSVDGT